MSLGWNTIYPSNPLLDDSRVLVLDPEIASALSCGRLYGAMDACRRRKGCSGGHRHTRNRGVLLLWARFPTRHPGISRSRSKQRHFEGLKPTTTAEDWAQNCPENFETALHLSAQRSPGSKARARCFF